MSFTALLNATGALKRPSRSENSFSLAGTESYSTVATVAMSLQPLNAVEQQQYGKTIGNVSHRMFCDVREVRVGDLLVAAGRTYQVEGIMDAAGRGHHMEVLLNYKDER